MYKLEDRPLQILKAQFRSSSISSFHLNSYIIRLFPTFTARTRNSIATCTVDPYRYSNKRPHSIISVSSNSSSNSSHSGFNAMNLAFNPVDSPRTYRRSLTFTGNTNWHWLYGEELFSAINVRIYKLPLLNHVLFLK